jgi:hypothetical protein
MISVSKAPESTDVIIVAGNIKSKVEKIVNFDVTDKIHNSKFTTNELIVMETAHLNMMTMFEISESVKDFMVQEDERFSADREKFPQLFRFSRSHNK